LSACQLQEPAGRASTGVANSVQVGPNVKVNTVLATQRWITQSVLFVFGFVSTVIVVPVS